MTFSRRAHPFHEELPLRTNRGILRGYPVVDTSDRGCAHAPMIFDYLVNNATFPCDLLAGNAAQEHGDDRQKRSALSIDGDAGVLPRTR